MRGAYHGPMRILGVIVIAGLGMAFAVPGLAAPAPAQPESAPPLRYSVEIPPGTDGTPPAAPLPQPGPAAAPVTAVQTAPAPPVRKATAEPAVNPPMRYGIETEEDGGQPNPSAPAPRQPRYSAGIPPHGAAPPRAAPHAPVIVTGNRDYRLGAGDKVHITVYGEPDLTGDFEVSGSGRLAFPLIGDVKAAGLTAPALGEAIAKRLAGGYLKDPRVAIEITTYRPFYIVGQVNKPGKYAYVNGMTAMNAIALAGGFTPSASEDYVYVRHAGETKEARVPADDATEIEPGDVVRVEQSGFWSLMSVLRPLASIAGVVRYGIP